MPAPTVDVEPLTLEHPFYAVVGQPAHGRVGGDAPVDDWEVKEVNLLLGYFGVSSLVGPRQDLLSVLDIGPQAVPRPPLALGDVDVDLGLEANESVHAKLKKCH